MSHINTTGASNETLIPIVLASVPLATGDSVVVGGSEEQITGIRVVISTADSADAFEVDLEFRFGGWWAR